MLSKHAGASWVNEKLTTGFCPSATQHGNKPPSRHEAESLKRRAHHSPYTSTLTTFTFPENNPLIQAVYGQSVVIVAASRHLPEFVRHHPPLHLTDSMTGLLCCQTGFRDNLPEWHILPLPAFHSGQ